MPYSRSNMPAQIKGLPTHAQDIFMAAFNAAYKEYSGDETKSTATAWSAVKDKYKKEGDKWVAKEINHSEEIPKEIPKEEIVLDMEIFSGGPQTDSNGTTHDGDTLIENALKAFDKSKFQPPVRLDHKDGPAYGWVQGLKKVPRDGLNHLIASVGLIPEAVDLVRRKLYKERSAGFSKDGSLNHLALLGAACPAVKGLAPVELSEDNVECIIFSYEGNLLEETIQEESLEMTEELVKKALAEQKTALEAQFTAKIKQIEFQSKQKEIQTFITSLVEKGKITPACVEKGLAKFMESLLDVPSFNFGEENIEISPIAWFQNYLANKEVEVAIGEFDTFSKRESKTTNEYDKLNKLAEQYVKDHKVTFGEALDNVARIHNIKVM